MTHTSPAADRLLARPEVQEITGFSVGHLYALMREGKFPTALKVSHRCVRWRQSEVEAYIAALPRANGRSPT